MNKALKVKTSRILCALICLALALGVFVSVGLPNGFYARADEAENTEFVKTELSLSNNQFENTSGSDFPKTPNDWTEEGNGNVIHGVMDLSSYLENSKNYKLGDDYKNEFPDNVVPQSPFGTGNYEGTNRNVLFINARPSNSTGTVYGYTSGSVTFTANRFYSISAWVRTGKFTGNAGAAIRLNGLNDSVAFNKINTVADIALDASNDYGFSAKDNGWQMFQFYIASSSYADSTVSLTLSVGDKYNGKTIDGKEVNAYYPATGYAMFDNIQAYEISPAAFYEAQKLQAEANSANVIIKDYSNKTSDDFLSVENLDFTQALSPAWQTVTGKGAGSTNLSNVTISTYNGSRKFYEENDYHFTSDPMSANGKYLAGDSDILVISSYKGDGFQSVAAGVSSKPFTLKRYRYYRISAWVKSQEVTDGSGATLALSVPRGSDNEYEGNSIFATITSCTGDSANRARGGFSQYSFYVKGSVFKDYDASIECWLGTAGSESAGIALFDNITIEEITPSDYGSYGGDNGINLDTYSGVNGSAFVTYPDTGITNGSFYEIDTYEEFGYPLSPASWTMHTPDTAGTTGYSANKVETDDIISGIIPTDRDTFTANQADFGKGAYNHATTSGSKNKNSMLMMYSDTPTAYCYRSSSFTVSADAPGALSVHMLTDGIEGYGASLVLKNNTSVIATIEKIDTNRSWKTYTFYIEPGSADISTLSVEIWLGNSDRSDNTSKLSKGHIYVDEVAYSAINSEDSAAATTEFNTRKTAYDDARHANNSQIGFAAYSFKNIDFSAFDYYDTSYVKYPYNWDLSVAAGESGTVRYGIFDPSGAGKDSTVPPYFKNADDAVNYGVLMLNNTAPAASTLTYNGTITLAADTYYKVDISIKTDIPAQERANAVGANISLSGTNFSFKNIKDTSTRSDSIVNGEAFQTYTFYIKGSGEESTVSIAISLGESDYSKQCSGRVYVNSITYTDITNVAYEEAADEIAKRDDGKEYGETYKNAMLADLTEKTEDDDNTDEPAPKDNTLSWWLIPSILFAVAIVIAIVGAVIRKFVEKRADKKGVVQKTMSYDRNATLNRDYNKDAAAGDKLSGVSGADDSESYEAFNDDAEIKAAKVQKAETAEAPATRETVKEVKEPTEDAEEAKEPESEEITATASNSAEQTETKEPETEQAEKEAAKEEVKKDESFIDRFDD